MFRILCVCTGNICRSPAVQILLARHLDASVEVTSAGTHGMPQWPVSAQMAALLGPDSPDVAAFVSSTLTEKKIRGSNLILALSAEHKRAILEAEPVAMRRTFTLGELARIAAAIPPDVAAGWQTPDKTDAQRLTELVRAAGEMRRRIPARAPSDDVVDPYGRGEDVYLMSYSQLATFLNQILHTLHG